MALTSYTELKTSIANWLNRRDLTTEISDDFIKLVEADFNSKLRVRKMIAQTSFTIDSETEALPTGFLQVRDIYILSGSTKYPLRYMTPPQMDQVRGTSRTGLPLAYTILGDTFRFMPKPDSSYTAYIGGINPQQVQTWQQMYGTAMERLEQNDREDQFSGSPLQIRSEDTVSSPFKTLNVTTTNSA